MKWIVKRMIKAAITVYVVLTFTFFLIRMMPGNPIQRAIQEYMMKGIPEYQARNIVSTIFQLDLSTPVIEQYIQYLGNLARGTLGKSLTLAGTPVITLIGYALPWTVFVLSVSILASFLLGILTGVAMAYKRRSILDNVALTLSTVLTAVPNYIFAMFALFALAFIWPIFPKMGAYDITITPGFTPEFIFSVLYYASLPFLTYVATTVGGWALYMRGSTIDVLGEDYVMAAEARGLSSRRVMMSYVGRNAMLPLFTSLTISMGYIFGGSVLIETIFVYPGIGYLLSVAVSRRDYTIMQACFLLTTITVVLANFFADILYSKLDPRIRLE